jgi:hypothetical protein
MMNFWCNVAEQLKAEVLAATQSTLVAAGQRSIKDAQKSNAALIAQVLL